jgi:hypothetical protein
MLKGAFCDAALAGNNRQYTGALYSRAAAEESNCQYCFGLFLP